ncbi:hypothetical protein Tco_1451319 [Tanacetum coccineum]
MEVLLVSTSNSTTVGPYGTGGTNDGVAASLQLSQIHNHMLMLKLFQDDAKYEHVGQDIRMQDGKDDKVKQGKYLKISELKTKSKDNDKGSRSKIT